ncbi:39602_t:CDS:2, partial [Gigaspora margarita]
MLSDEILPAFGSQVPSVCSIPRPDILNTNDIENEFVNYDISDRNKHQNVEFKDQEKLEIVSGLIFQTWEQLDRYIRMYTKQNGFVSIITCSKSDDITRRRCRYACEHQGIGHSKKTAILKNQKQAYTKRLGYKWLVNAKIHPDAINFAPYYWQFPDKVKQEIKYYTSKGLNLSDTIQSFKKQNKVVNKASVLLKTLFNNKAQDPNWRLLISRYPVTKPYLEQKLYVTKEQWVLAWISNRFTAGVQSIQRVEGVNATIKSSSIAHVQPTHITASAQLLPERAKIAEALWYSAKLVSKESINISLLQEQSMVDFYENLDDFPATNVNEIIS